MLDSSIGLDAWWGEVTGYFRDAVANVWGIFSIFLMLCEAFFLVVFVILIVRFFKGFGGTKAEDPGKKD